jgi:hypothetical protein
MQGPRGLMLHSRQRHRVAGATRSGAGASSISRIGQRPCRGPCRVSATASLQEAAASSTAETSDPISADATSLIGNTPMVCACLSVQQLQQRRAAAECALYSMQVYLNSVTKQGCFAKIACKLELMQPCCRYAAPAAAALVYTLCPLPSSVCMHACRSMAILTRCGVLACAAASKTASPWP